MSSPKHHVQTPRLDLIPYAPEHTDQLHAMNSNEEVMRYLGDVQTLEQTQEGVARVQARWAQYGYGWWSVFLKGTDTLIGAACLQNLAHIDGNPLEIGWRFIPKYHGKGYATEAGQAAMDFGFDVVGVDYVVAVTEQENIASQKVMQRLDMTHIGIQRHYDVDCVVYEMHKT